MRSKMKKFIVMSTAVFIFGWVLAACATPPTNEMNRATDAVTRAENDADAVTYAPNTLIRAREDLARMQSEADAKRYDAAKNYAAEAINEAERAIVEGRAGALRARDEAVNLINNVGNLQTETTNALNTARQVSGLQLDFDSLSWDLDAAGRLYDEARQSLQANNYPDTIARAGNARSIFSDINTRITGAAQDSSRKR
jgi:hypothetical protein